MYNKYYQNHTNIELTLRIIENLSANIVFESSQLAYIIRGLFPVIKCQYWLS